MDKKTSSETHIISHKVTEVAKTYHMRRKEREIGAKAKMRMILAERPFITIAMCRADEPYLVTVNHALDPGTDRLYFHCAQVGKKIDFLEKNPNVYAQAVEDRGYVKDKCDYDYATVNISGRASKVDSDEEKFRALDLLLEKLEPEIDADDARKKFVKGSSLGKVSIYRIDISSMTGKTRVP